MSHLIHLNTHLLQVCASEINLSHELLVSLGDVVEGHDIVAEFAKEICAEGDEGPEGDLCVFSQTIVELDSPRIGRAYVGNNILLKLRRQGDQAKEEGQVELRDVCVSCVHTDT